MPTNIQLVFETDARKSLTQQKKLKDDLRSVEKTAKDSQEKVRGEFNKTADTIRKVGTALGVTFGAAVILRGLKDTLRTLREFEVELAGLRSITGMAAEDMVFMKEKAIELSEASTKSAKEVVEAFKLVGSAKPELLKSAAALAEVTKQAIILAEAGGITVPEAALALTGALNQFGKGAKDAAKFTDILATSQQKGSAFIASLAEAMVNAGSVANALGISFETTNAVLQGFAKGTIVGARAGHAFESMMMKLATQSNKEFNPRYTEMNELLDNLANAHLTDAQAIKLVERENLKYLYTLIEQREIVKELNGSLYEQGNALEQARINTDTMDTSLKNVGKSWDNFVLSIKAGSGVVSKSIKAIADDITRTFTEMGRVQRAEFEGAGKLMKFALQLGSIIDPTVRQYANAILEATGEAEALDEQMDELIADTDDLNAGLGGDTGTVGLIGDLKEQIKGLNDEFAKAKTPEEIGKINIQLAELNKQLKELAEIGIVKPIQDALKGISDLDIEDELLETEDLQNIIGKFGEWYANKRAEEGNLEIENFKSIEDAKLAIRQKGLETAGDLIALIAKKEQTAAIGRALISGAEAILKIAATYPPPYSIALQVLQGIQTLAQVALIKSQKFATGIIGLRGRGTGTSDSIPTMLSKGESVITAKKTSEYYPYLKLMEEGTFYRFQEEMVDKLAGFKAITNNNLNYDNTKELKRLDRIVNALEKQQSSEYIDGKYKIIKKGNITTRISLN